MKVTKTERNHPINEKQFKKWITALRSGKYSQTTSTLEDKDGFCCLGVACKVIIPKSKQNIDDYDGFLRGGLPTDHQPAPQWLLDMENDVHHRTNIGIGLEDAGKYISTLNDNMRLSFDEIADVLELIYVHGALE